MGVTVVEQPTRVTVADSSVTVTVPTLTPTRLRDLRDVQAPVDGGGYVYQASTGMFVPASLATQAALNAEIARAEAAEAAIANGGSLTSTGSNPITLTPGTSGTVIVHAPDESSTMIQFEDIAATSGKFAGAFALSGTNGNGPGGRVVAIGVDTAATIPYRDFFMSRANADGTISDADGLYGSLWDGTAAQPASWAFGQSAPSSTYRLMVQPGAGNLAQGGLIVRTNPSQTGNPFVVSRGLNDTSGLALAVLGSSSYATVVTSSPLNRTVTDGVTTSGSPTVTSATANFTNDDFGRYLTGAGIPSGSYISAVNSTGSVTISQNATATATGVSLTVVVPNFLIVTNGHAPMFSASGASGAPSVSIPVALVGIGPGAPATPTATVDVAQTGTANATFKLRTASNGSLAINALGASAEVDIWTANASVLKLGTNSTQAVKITTAQSVLVGSAAIATSSTDGFLYIAAASGTPTGVPTTQAGFAPLYYDTTNHKLWVYDSGWKGVVVA